MSIRIALDNRKNDFIIAEIRDCFVELIEIAFMGIWMWRFVSQFWIDFWV